MEMDQLYTELILEHNQDKRNKHELTEFTTSEHGHNPSCGDDLTLQLNVVWHCKRCSIYWFWLCY